MAAVNMATMTHTVVLVLLSCWLACVAHASATTMERLGSSLELFEFVGESHYEFGYAMGKHFRSQINARVAAHDQLQRRLLPFYATEVGKRTYTMYHDQHNTTFPEYVEELEGIADGSGVPFPTVFLLNIVEEYGNSVPRNFDFLIARARSTLKCSDIILVGRNVCAVAHNEDSGASDVNHTAIIRARIGTESPMFVAYTYLGDLPSGAFGFNDRGIAFTLNFVQPASIDVGGLGRGFISRDLLGAVDAQNAIDRITRPHQAGGHNFQLMEVHSQRIWNIEVASFNRVSIRQFPSVGEVNVSSSVEAFFHANQYQTLQIEQPPYASSIHRLKRYAQLTPPTTIDEALDILGDQADPLYPIFHDKLSHAHGELSGWTLITIVFDLLQAKAFSYRSNPRNRELHLIWDLRTLAIRQVVAPSTSG